MTPEERREHCRRIASKGGQTTVKRHGKRHMSELGQRGGSTTVARHGKRHMSAIGRRGGHVTQQAYYHGEYWQLWLAGEVGPGDPAIEELKRFARAQFPEAGI